MEGVASSPLNMSPWQAIGTHFMFVPLCIYVYMYMYMYNTYIYIYIYIYQCGPVHKCTVLVGLELSGFELS